LPVIATSFFAESIRPKTRAESPTSQGTFQSARLNQWQRQNRKCLFRKRQFKLSRHVLLTVSQLPFSHSDLS